MQQISRQNKIVQLKLEGTSSVWPLNVSSGLLWQGSLGALRHITDFCWLFLNLLLGHSWNYQTIDCATSLLIFLVPRNDQINKYKYTSLIILLKHTSCSSFECKACKHHVWSGRRSEDWGLWSGHQWWWWWRENSVQRNSILHGSWTSEMVYTDNNVYFLCFIG